MQKEILELRKNKKNRNIDKAYEQAKRLNKINKNNKEIIKILAFLFIQRNQFDSDLIEHYPIESSFLWSSLYYRALPPNSQLFGPHPYIDSENLESDFVNPIQYPEKW